MLLKTLIPFIAGILLWPSALNAQTVLFAEDFESVLSQWVGKDGGLYSGELHFRAARIRSGSVDSDSALPVRTVVTFV